MKPEVVTAIPYRVVNGEVEIMLVTSQKKGKWIFPKGNVDEGETPSMTAEKEAWEEAGVRGSSGQEALLKYTMETAEGPVLNEVFPVRVEEILKSWPEKKLRRRKWAKLESVCKIVKKQLCKDVVPEVESFFEGFPERRGGQS